MVHPSQQRAFGQRKMPSRVIIARGSKIRTFAVRPWVFGTVVGIFLMFTAGYVAATGYLVYRDDIVGATFERQAGMQRAYEERIALLRSELDRVTSRHIVETQTIESQVGSLVQRQELIDRRQAVLARLVAKARSEGMTVADTAIPIPIPRPAQAGDAIVRIPASNTVSDEAFAYAPESPSAAEIITNSIIKDGPLKAPMGEEALRPLLDEIRTSIDEAEDAQTSALDVLYRTSKADAKRLAGILGRFGLNIPDGAGEDESGTGGPFLPIGNVVFVEKADSTGKALEKIRIIRESAAGLPLAKPLQGGRWTSNFGIRVDPFLRKPAMHSGVDFGASYGTPVEATADGIVVHAGFKGGYGRMVEIRHGHGFTTRYAHMSAIKVKEGEQVAAGTIVGHVGSSGRSTGPHLHYETRRGDKALDPTIFLGASQYF
jgi:murein DD-endopeptidase MepM/ murein hydrolase activator NlpD